ncbi:GlxA family transcriptional regulator [Hasllibacter sp. MH4015]|uniref:GlxA family transcriptional regulator n=1 Tax=Hasllibacter sp. MH4015 TaxID=2854029 RepID=UPI001CD19FEF|nr:GlxA family transcriptional regulator [Hasllibacter sp. MH4015]
MRRSTEPERFALLLFDGFSNLCLANAVEPLRAANTLSRRTLYDWRFFGMSGAPLASSSGVPVQPDALGAEARGDYLFVMPSYGHEALANAATGRALRAAAKHFGTLVGLDTGSWLMAHAGLLDGYRATSHWDILADLAETFPEVDVTEARFVVDRDRASCGGATTTFDLMLDLIEGRHGAALSLEVAALFMHGERDPALDPARLMPDCQTIRAAAAIMRRHIEEPLTIGAVASCLGLSQRALERAFRSHGTQTPAAAYRAIRLSEARRRVEQTRDSIAEISLRSGYGDATAMTRAFKAAFGITPSAARAARLRKG